MNEDEFFEKLRKLTAEGQVSWTDVGGWFRCASGMCPIMAVYRSEFPGRGLYYNGSYAHAAANLGIMPDDARLIAEAADGRRLHSEHVRLADRLLEACFGT